ncbi:tyrosine-type recombinase/integrase [Dyella sp. SG609]|uniref:tyrosine-type recombinase/integrase n=1 Tax=Dyella sp. SG609 TaxID=2587018 RepID=UPI001447157F|nr:tyrosine-type recombinase/integrase [Dyella sp. SG609]NKJ21963.1 integrase [Dyella sp. SG609]
MAKVTLYWRDGTAYLNWRDGNGRQRKSIGRRGAIEAETIRAAKEAELTYGVRIISTAPKLADFIEHYLEWYKAEHPRTHGKAKSELRLLKAEFGHRPIDTITTMEIEAHKARRLTKDRAAKETVSKELRRFRTAIRRGMRWKLFQVDPMEGVEIPRGVRSVAVKFYGKKELVKLYEANPSRSSLWRFMTHTGIRRGEVAGCSKEKVRRNVLHVESEPGENEEGRTKSGRWRDVPLNKEARKAFAELPDPLVSVHPDTISDWFAEDAKKAGIGGSLHRLRHTFGATLTMAGVPLRRIQLLMGHADYATTEKYYAHLTPNGSDKAVMLLEKLL